MKLALDASVAVAAAANYVALARLLKCQLVTLDARMRRGTARLGCSMRRSLSRRLPVSRSARCPVRPGPISAERMMLSGSPGQCARR